MPRLAFHPATADRWDDLEALFGRNGAYANCWCTWWRLKRADFDSLGGDRKKALLEKEVAQAPLPPGILAYEDGRPVAWCAVAPRAATPVLARSPLYKPVDDVEGTWAITCFFVARDRRGQGLMEPLVRAAVAHARRHGARAVEGIPVEPEGEFEGAQGFTGVASVYRRLGFREVARRSPKRPLMRLDLAPPS